MGQATTFFEIVLVFIVIVLAVSHWPFLQVAQTYCRYTVAVLVMFSGINYSLVVSRKLAKQE